MTTRHVEFVGGSMHRKTVPLIDMPHVLRIPVFDPVVYDLRGPVFSAYSILRHELYRRTKIGHLGKRGEPVLDWVGYVLDGYWGDGDE